MKTTLSFLAVLFTLTAHSQPLQTQAATEAMGSTTNAALFFPSGDHPFAITNGVAWANNAPAADTSPIADDVARLIGHIKPKLTPSQTQVLAGIIVALGGLLTKALAQLLRKYWKKAQTGKIGTILSHVALESPQIAKNAAAIEGALSAPAPTQPTTSQTAQNTMKRIILTIATAVALLAATGAQAQNVPTSLQGATNVLASGGGLAPVNALLNILPSWDPTATNTFGSGEVTIESAPLWKSQTAAGTTPYNSTEVDYFFTRNIGAGAEVISLGSGTGNSTIDSLNVNLTLREDSGNIAIYGIAGRWV